MRSNRYTYIWVSLIVLIFGIIVIPRIVERIREGEVVENDRMSRSPSDRELSYITLNGKKRKVPPFAFYDQDSMLITREDFLGKVYLVDFFFTTCPTICPVMTKNLVSLQDTFDGREDFGIASFTINPRYDSPSVLKAYAEKYGITDMDWHLLTGNRDSIYALANAGFNIYAAADEAAEGGFEHSGLLALIDREGYIRSRLDSYGNPMVYYRGTITEEQGMDSDGQEEQISLLREDIEKLLEE